MAVGIGSEVRYLGVFAGIKLGVSIKDKTVTLRSLHISSYWVKNTVVGGDNTLRKV